MKKTEYGEQLDCPINREKKTTFSEYVEASREALLALKVHLCICTMCLLLNAKRGKHAKRLLINLRSCFPARHLERAVVPDGPRPATGMEEDNRHGRQLLLAHPHRCHPVGEAGAPSSTLGSAGTGWQWHLDAAQTLSGLAELLANPRS